MSANAMLRTDGVGKDFPIRSGVFVNRVGSRIRAVDDVNLELAPGTTLGLVGESGCGKSTLGRMIVRLLEPTSGEVVYDGRELSRIRRSEWRALRPQVQMVFQDTQSSLDPRLTVEAAIGEPLRLNSRLRGVSLYRAVSELVDHVGLDQYHLQSRPHELSGGQRQRVVIARALATEPKLIVLDEPTSALDVSVQAQILNLLKDLQDELSLTYLFISHNLTVVRGMSDTVAVMYLGRVVETGPAEKIFARPVHPYTRMLLSSVPRPDPRVRRQRFDEAGELPRPDDPPPGCAFHPRCPSAAAVCSAERPELLEHAPGYAAACHFAGEFLQQSFEPVVTQRRRA